MLIVIFYLPNIVIDKMNLIMCENNVKTKILSPDKKKVIYIFERNCGATTDVFYNATLERNGEVLSPRRGNVTHSKSELNAKWLNNNNVEIFVKNKSDIIWKIKKLKNINFNYQEY